MADLLRKQSLPPPEFDVSSLDTFKLIMRSEKQDIAALQLNERQLKAVEHMQSAKTLTNAQYQELFNASKPTATRDLAELVAKGLILREGTRGGQERFTGWQSDSGILLLAQLAHNWITIGSLPGRGE